jgi:hypothetical protein
VAHIEMYFCKISYVLKNVAFLLLLIPWMHFSTISHVCLTQRVKDSIIKCMVNGFTACLEYAALWGRQGHKVAKGTLSPPQGVHPLNWHEQFEKVSSSSGRLSVTSPHHRWTLKAGVLGNI